jgi:hypothetical protein
MFLEGVGENLAADAVWLTLVSVVVTRGVFRVAAYPVAVATLVRRRSTFRFSACAIMRVKRGNQFLMVMTPARGDSLPYWGPLGGVLKCRHSAVNLLSDLDVQTDWLPTADDDMNRDLRVKMQGARFWRFMRWYWKGDGRESPSDALTRELKEELGEVDLDGLDRLVEQLEFTVSSPRAPRLYRQDGMWHFRLFYVLDAVKPLASEFEEKLFDALPRDDLAFIAEDEIKRGTHAGVAVGGHGAFLIPGGKWVNRHPAYQ